VLVLFGLVVFVTRGREASRCHWSHHLVVCYRVTKKLGCIGFITDSKGKQLVVAGEGINTPNTPYLR
jgi:hypothetical protein